MHFKSFIVIAFASYASGLITNSTAEDALIISGTALGVAGAATLAIKNGIQNKKEEEIDVDRLPKVHAEVIKKDNDITSLYDEEVRPFINEKDYTGRTPLEHALENRNNLDEKSLKNVVQSLVYFGADVHAPFKDTGKTVFEYHRKLLNDVESHPIEEEMSASKIRERLQAHEKPNLFPYLQRSMDKDVAEEDPKLFYDLLEGGADPNRIHSKTGAIAIHRSVDSDPSKFEALVEKGSDLNRKDSRGDSPLNSAIRRQQFQTALKLAQNPPVDTNLANHYGETPLIMLGKVLNDVSYDFNSPTQNELFNVLLKKTRNINRRDIRGRTAKDVYKLPMLQRMLELKGAKPGAPVEGVPVYLNIYHTNLRGEQLSKYFNAVADPVRMGMYHSSIEIGEGEGDNHAEAHNTGSVSFDKGEEVMTTKTTKKLYRKLLLGTIKEEPSKVIKQAEILKNALKPRYNNKYNEFNNNCHEFSMEFYGNLKAAYPAQGLKSFPHSQIALHQVLKPMIPA